MNPPQLSESEFDLQKALLDDAQQKIVKKILDLAKQGVGLAA